MTAEILIMNKNGVAMAADSIVTLTAENYTRKTFNTANKLFALSKNEPVGIMVSQKVLLLDYPWEVIIKQFRKYLGKKAFDKLEEYSLEFIKFLTQYFPHEEQIDYAKNVCEFAFSALLNRFETEIKKETNISDDEKELLLLEIAKILDNQFQSYKDFNDLPNDFNKDCEKLYGNELSKWISSFFPFLTNESPTHKFIYYMCINFFQKDFYTPNDFPEYSGIVIAGYGEKDRYSKYSEVRIYGIINNCVLMNGRRDYSLLHKKDSCVVAFAQQDVVRTYIDGINPDMENVYNNYLEIVINSFFQFLKDNFPKEIVTEEFIASIDSVVKNTITVGKENIAIEKQKLISPFLNALKFLPKDELANIAENLVNLTSFRRKMSEEIETVGGPIDVLVISKGDGLVWVKRKLYFPPDLNHQYFKRYNDC